MGSQNSAAALQSNLAVLQTVKYRINTCSSNSTPWYTPKRDEHVHLHKNRQTSVHSSVFIIAKGGNSPQTHPPGRGKPSAVCPHHGTSYTTERNEEPRTMTRKKYSTTRKKPDTKVDDSIHMKCPTHANPQRPKVDQCWPGAGDCKCSEINGANDFTSLLIR